jgi:hypothetical protein
VGVPERKTDPLLQGWGVEICVPESCLRSPCCLSGKSPKNMDNDINIHINNNINNIWEPDEQAVNKFVETIWNKKNDRSPVNTQEEKKDIIIQEIKQKTKQGKKHDDDERGLMKAAVHPEWGTGETLTSKPEIRKTLVDILKGWRQMDKVTHAVHETEVMNVVHKFIE